MLARLKAAGRMLLKGEGGGNKRQEIPAITPAEIEEVRQFFPRRKFFIMGHARSGTTLLMRLVRLHPEVHCSYQAHFFTRRPLLKSLVDTSEAEEWLARKSNRWNRGRDLSPVVLRAAADMILERDAQRVGKNIVGDKSPSSNIHGQAVREMHAVYPDARLVCIVRDGRDVAVSERFRNLVEESRFLSAEDRRILAALRKDASPFLDGSRSIFTDAFLRRVGSGWARNLDEIETEARRLYAEAFLTLRYEDLLHNPFDEMSRLWRFLGVRSLEDGLKASIEEEQAANPDEEWQSQRGPGISALLPKGKPGNWLRLFTQRDRQTFKEAAGETLLRWRYESSHDW